MEVEWEAKNRALKLERKPSVRDPRTALHAARGITGDDGLPPTASSLPSALNVKVKKFNQARVNGGSNYDSLSVASRSMRPEESPGTTGYPQRLPHCLLGCRHDRWQLLSDGLN